MRHEQFGPAAPRDPTPRPERPGPSRVLLSLIFLIACAGGAAAMGTRELDPVLSQARSDLAAAQADIAAARAEKDQLKAIQLFQGASQRYQTIVDALSARLQLGKDPGGRVQALLTTVLLDKARIDRELKNYDASITSLTAVIRQNPDRFDQANGQIREIIGIREKYAQIAADLFSVIKTKDMSLAANQDYVSQRTQELQRLDPYGNQDILIRISEAILKSQNLRVMRAIMTQARSLLDSGRFAEALAVYEKGFELYRQQYEDAGYDRRDDQSGSVLVVDSAGQLATLAIDSDGTLLRTDKNGRIEKSPDGKTLPLLDAQGQPRRLSFLLAGGRQKLQAGQGSVVEYAEARIKDAEGLAGMLAAGPGSFSGLDAAVQNLAAAFAADDAVQAGAALQPLQKSLAELLAAIGSVDTAGQRLQALADRLPKKRGAVDISYIQYAYPSYADFFIRGRPVAADYDRLDALGDPSWRPPEERDKPEGLEGTLLAFYASRLETLQTAFEAPLEKDYAAAQIALDARSWEEARAAFDRVTKLAPSALQVLGLWSAAYTPAAAPNLSDAARSIAARKAADARRIQHFAFLAADYGQLTRIAANADKVYLQARAFLAGLNPQAPFGGTLASLLDFRVSLGTADTDILNLPSNDGGLAGELATWAKSDSGDARSRQAQADFDRRIAEALALVRGRETELVLAAAKLQTNEVQTQLDGRNEAVRAADELTVGPLSTLPNRDGLHDPTPSRGVSLLTVEEQRIAAVELIIKNARSGLDAELPEIKDDPAVKAERDRLDAESARLAALKAYETEAMTRARDHKRLAEVAIKAADASLAEARRLLASSQAKGSSPTAARQNLDLSATRLSEALAKILEWSTNDFDPQRWNDYYNNQYSKLKVERDQADESFVLNETFRLLDDGQRYYNQQLYDQAGEALDSAQRLWLTKNNEEQPQVKYWQNFVKMAQDTNNKREVRQSEPLYYDISNYLSQARSLYVRGDGLMKSGDRAGAAKAFDAARQNISYVTRAFPLNAEAGLLTLQILKSTDQAAYNESLPSRIQAARDLLAADPQTAYSRIADLSRMEPGNATIQNLLKQAEVKTGRRPPEPSRDQLARAANLVAQAERLMKTGRSSDNASASELLNQAYLLDPGNAKALADIKYLTILSGKGGPAGPALGPADQALLDTATGQYAAGQYNNARDTLNRLLQTGRMTKDILKLDQNLKQLGY